MNKMTRAQPLYNKVDLNEGVIMRYIVFKRFNIIYITRFLSVLKRRKEIYWKNKNQCSSNLTHIISAHIVYVINRIYE